MTDEELRRVVLDALASVAPEADVGSLDPAVDLLDQLDLDSMDTLNWAIAVHESTGIDIPERDYGKLATIDSAVAYLAGRDGARTG